MIILNKALKNKKGITLVELLIALVILLIVLTLGYTTFHFLYTSYDKSEENWIVSQDVRTVSEWIDKNMQTAYILEIYDAIPASFAADDAYYYMYNDDGRVYVRMPGQAAPIFLAGESVKAEFSYKDTSPNALDYVITGSDLKTKKKEVYSVKGTLLILNITADKKINHNTSGTVSDGGICIKFKSTAAPTGIKEMIDYIA